MLLIGTCGTVLKPCLQTLGGFFSGFNLLQMRLHQRLEKLVMVGHLEMHKFTSDYLSF
jgi:hypothetical protein